MTRILTEKECALFTAYLAALNAASIPHAIARNHEGFPERIGHDVDLLLPRHRWREARAIFRKLLAGHNGTMWKENPRDFVLDLRFSLPGSPSPLHLDIYWGVFTWHGLAYVDETAALRQSLTFPCYRAVRPAHEIMGMYCASLLWGSFYKGRYGPQMRATLADPVERAAFDACCTAAFGPSPLPIIPGAEPEPSANEARVAAASLRSRLKTRAFRKNPFFTLFALARHTLTEVFTLFRPTGLSIAILGPDGSGKSTVTSALADRLEPLFVKLRLFHWRPGVLPDAGVAARLRTVQTGEVKTPHAKPPHSAPVSFARLCWYACDYWLGHLLRVRKGRAQSDLVLFDRHAADMACDPRRYRLGLPRWLLRAAVTLLPKPQLTFVLLADAETLTRRKGEIPSESVEQVLANYRQLAASGGRVRGVDATRSVEEVVANIERQVLEHMKASVRR